MNFSFICSDHTDGLLIHAYNTHPIQQKMKAANIPHYLYVYICSAKDGAFKSVLDKMNIASCLPCHEDMDY